MRPGHSSIFRHFWPLETEKFQRLHLSIWNKVCGFRCFKTCPRSGRSRIFKRPSETWPKTTKQTPKQGVCHKFVKCLVFGNLSRWRRVLRTIKKASRSHTGALDSHPEAPECDLDIFHSFVIFGPWKPKNSKGYT